MSTEPEPQGQNQHEVPDFYQRYFLDPTQQSKLQRLDLRTGVIRPASPRSTASEDDLYEVPNPALAPLEKHFASVESKVGTLLPSARVAPLHGEDEKNLSAWMAYQFVRTRAYRDALRGTAGSTLLQAVRRIATPTRLDDAWADLEEANRNFLLKKYGTSSARRLFFSRHEVVGHIHRERLWEASDEVYWRHAVVVTRLLMCLFERHNFEYLERAKPDFITSDHPVTLTEEFGADRELSLVYPLSPNVCLVGAWAGDGYRGPSRRFASDEEVVALNNAQVATARTFLMASSRAALERFAAPRPGGSRAGTP